MYQYLRTLEPEGKNLGFLFDNEEKNPGEIEGVRVYDLGNTDPGNLDLGAVVYIATRGIFHEHIKGVLLVAGFASENIISVTPQLDTKLRNEYVEKIYKSEGRTFEKIFMDEDMMESAAEELGCGDACIYVAKTTYDKDFSEEVSLKEYEAIIQAGTILADGHLEDAAFYDDRGENISDRNRQFCELTALYWIWKNAKQEVIGLEHWRRRFLLPDNWMERLESGKIDVILPVPLCVMPSLEENYKSRHDRTVWDKMVAILKELYPEDGEAAEMFFREKKLYSPCNMIIARREVLRDYCDWLFPILLRLNDEIGALEDAYQNRYPGFISERLLNYYFDKRRDILHIVYADKSFLN